MLKYWGKGAIVNQQTATKCKEQSVVESKHEEVVKR